MAELLLGWTAVPERAAAGGERRQREFPYSALLGRYTFTDRLVRGRLRVPIACAWSLTDRGGWHLLPSADGRSWVVQNSEAIACGKVYAPLRAAAVPEGSAAAGSPPHGLAWKWADGCGGMYAEPGLQLLERDTKGGAALLLDAEQQQRFDAFEETIRASWGGQVGACAAVGVYAKHGDLDATGRSVYVTERCAVAAEQQHAVRYRATECRWVIGLHDVLRVAGGGHGVEWRSETTTSKAPLNLRWQSCGIVAHHPLSVQGPAAAYFTDDTFRVSAISEEEILTNRRAAERFASGAVTSLVVRTAGKFGARNAPPSLAELPGVGPIREGEPPEMWAKRCAAVIYRHRICVGLYELDARFEPRGDAPVFTRKLDSAVHLFRLISGRWLIATTSVLQLQRRSAVATLRGVMDAARSAGLLGSPETCFVFFHTVQTDLVTPTLESAVWRVWSPEQRDAAFDLGGCVDARTQAEVAARLAGNGRSSMWALDATMSVVERDELVDPAQIAEVERIRAEEMRLEYLLTRQVLLSAPAALVHEVQNPMLRGALRDAVGVYHFDGPFSGYSDDAATVFYPEGWPKDHHSLFRVIHEKMINGGGKIKEGRWVVYKPEWNFNKHTRDPIGAPLLTSVGWEHKMPTEVQEWEMLTTAEVKHIQNTRSKRYGKAGGVCMTWGTQRAPPSLSMTMYTRCVKRCCCHRPIHSYSARTRPHIHLTPRHPILLLSLSLPHLSNMRRHDETMHLHVGITVTLFGETCALSVTPSFNTRWVRGPTIVNQDCWIPANPSHQGQNSLFLRNMHDGPIWTLECLGFVSCIGISDGRRSPLNLRWQPQGKALNESIDISVREWKESDETVQQLGVKPQDLPLIIKVAGPNAPPSVTGYYICARQFEEANLLMYKQLTRSVAEGGARKHRRPTETRAYVYRRGTDGRWLFAEFPIKTELNQRTSILADAPCPGRSAAPSWLPFGLSWEVASAAGAVGSFAGVSLFTVEKISGTERESAVARELRAVVPREFFMSRRFAPPPPPPVAQQEK